MINERFEEFLERQNKIDYLSKIDWSTKLQEWHYYLKQLYEMIETFLKPYIENGKISIEYGKKVINEENIGEYEVMTAMMHFGTIQVKMNPIGTNLIEAKGRVDMSGPVGIVRFVLVNSESLSPFISEKIWINGEEPSQAENRPVNTRWTWKIATQPPAVKYLSLEQESFLDALMEVANG